MDMEALPRSQPGLLLTKTYLVNGIAEYQLSSPRVFNTDTESLIPYLPWRRPVTHLVCKVELKDPRYSNEDI